MFGKRGLGKTPPIVCTLDIRKMQGKPMGGIVVVPRRAIGQWETQVPEHSAGRLSVFVPVGSSREKIDQLRTSTADINVLYPESIPHLAAYLTSRVWPFIIVDESTVIKNHRALRTKALFKMGRYADVRRIMTGLPNPNSPVDLFSQMEFIKPGIWGGAGTLAQRFYRFRDRYCVMGGFNQKQIVSYKNLDELSAIIAPYVSIMDNPVGLPELTPYDIDVELEGETLKHYESMRDELRTWWDGTEVKARLAVTQIMRLAQIAGGTVQSGKFKRFIDDTPKLRVLDEILEETIIKPIDKVVVFAIYEQEIEAIMRRYPQYLPRGIYGGVSERESTKAWQDFQKKGDPGQLIVCQSHSGGFGIDLYAARTAIFYTRDYSQEAYRQSVKRIHRIGQKGTVRILHLIARLPRPVGRRTRPVSIDESIAKVQGRKEKLSRMVLEPVKYGTAAIKETVNEVLY